MLNQKLYYLNKEYKEEDLEQIECIEEEDGTIRNRFMIKNHKDSPVFVEPVPDTNYKNWTVNEKNMTYDLKNPIMPDPFISMGTYTDIYPDFGYDNAYVYKKPAYGYVEYERGPAKMPNKMARDIRQAANTDYIYNEYPAKKEMSLDKAFKILMEHAEKWDAEDERPILDADAMAKTKALLKKYTKRIEEEAKKIPDKQEEKPTEKPVEKKNKLVDSLRKLFW